MRSARHPCRARLQALAVSLPSAPVVTAVPTNELGLISDSLIALTAETATAGLTSMETVSPLRRCTFRVSPSSDTISPRMRSGLHLLCPAIKRF